MMAKDWPLACSSNGQRIILHGLMITALLLMNCNGASRVTILEWALQSAGSGHGMLSVRPCLGLASWPCLKLQVMNSALESGSKRCCISALTISERPMTGKVPLQLFLAQACSFGTSFSLPKMIACRQEFRSLGKV